MSDLAVGTRHSHELLRAQRSFVKLDCFCGIPDYKTRSNGMETFRDWSCRDCHVIPPYMWPLAGLEISPKRSPTFYRAAASMKVKMLLKRKGTWGYGGNDELVQANGITGFRLSSRLSGGRLARSVAQA